MESYMQSLDSTLSYGPFANKELVYNMVRTQLINSPFLDPDNEPNEASLKEAIKTKSNELWEVMESLRSVKDWKVVEATRSLRTMYSQGGCDSPFHSYCLEGIVDAPLVHALCVMWEVPCFKKWWPRVSLPAFKVLESQWLKKIRICENLFHMRCKVPWPLATRELVVTSFEVEHPEEETIVGCLRSVPSDTSILKESIHGFNSTHLPPLKQDVVRMESSGGFMLQKITENKCYIRAIVHLDLKLDYVPTWIINFLGRQVVGHGFKLYLETVSSVKENKLFLDAIRKQHLYIRMVEEMKKRPIKSGHCNNT